MSNRNLLTALIANSEDVEDVANELSVDYTLIIKGLNDYDSLTRRELAELESAVATYVNIDLEDNDNERFQDVTEFAKELEYPDMFISAFVRDYFHSLVGNGYFEQDDLRIFGNIVNNLTDSQIKGILTAIANDEFTPEDLIRGYNLDGGDITSKKLKDSQFWAIARDYLDTD